MGRIGVSYEEVAQAAQEVQGGGKSPTVDNVRLIIGSGSKSTIARHLRDWRNQQGLARGSDGAIPSELLGLVKGLWERLRESVEQKAYDYQCEADTKIKQIQQQLTQSQQQNAMLREQSHQLEEKLHHQTEINKQLQATLVLEQQDKAKLSERVASQEVHHQEQQNEIERLHQLLKHVQNNLEHYQATTQQLRQEQSLIIEKQRNEYDQKISLQQQQIAKLSTEKSLYQSQFEQTRLILDVLQTKYESLSNSEQEIKIKYHSLSQDHSRQTQFHQDQSKELELKKQSVIELKIKLTGSEEKNILLENELSKAGDKIKILRDDLNFVAHEKASLEGQLKQLQKLIPIKQY